jgi:formylglycine-generating enzyme required for sulfatase activity
MKREANALLKPSCPETSGTATGKPTHRSSLQASRLIFQALLLGAALSAPASPSKDDMTRIPAGSVTFPFRSAGADSSAAVLKVAAFRLDKKAVSVSEYLAFVKATPRLSRARIPRLLADEGYLRDWKADLDPGSDRRAPETPVTAVSWHTAKAYCAAQGKRLPSTAEWELAAGTRAQGVEASAHERAILAWYARPASEGPPAFGQGTRHAHGVRDLHGVIWEWTSDYNAWSGAGVNRRGRADEADDGLFCGGGGSRMAAGTSYATYMRWAFRASLKPDYTVATLGFRCAMDEGKEMRNEK